MKKKMRVICALLLCCSLGLSSGLSVTASDQPALMSEDAESDEVLDAVENTDETEIEEAEKEEEEENQGEEPGETEEPETPETEPGESENPGTETEEPENPEEPGKDEEATGKPVLTYQAHIQRIGWQEWKNAGEEAGTVGESLRMEAIRIQMEDPMYEGNVEYRVHVQSKGWMDWVKNGEIAGTVGESLRIEAVQIRLTGELAEHYGLLYQTHVATFGWLGEVKGDDLSGTQGLAKRMECFKVQILPSEEMPEKSECGFIRSYYDSELTYKGHVQSIGDTEEVTGGKTLGTTGESLRVEGFEVSLDDSSKDVLEGSVEYCAHVQGTGWQDWRQEGEYAGTKGESKRIEAIKIKLTGEAADYFDIYYRCHVQNLGWMGWASNGAAAGTTKLSWRMEAFQIKIVPKGFAAPGSTEESFKEGKNGWFYEGGYKLYYVNGKLKTDVRSIVGKQSSYEIRINRQKSCVTVYAKDGTRGYIIPVIAFACSPGEATPTGTFYTSDKYRWHELYGAMGQWCTRITGHVLFHSPPYTKFDNHTLWAKEYNKIGTWASQGCVRLRSGDAKWIYDNCKSSTKVIIYNNSNPGPLGKPVYAKIPLSQNWDPTDPTV